MTTASYRPQIDLAAILAAQNPQVDLRLDEYERSTRSFMNLVANYTKKTTASVVEKTNAYNAEKTRLAEKIQNTKTEINQCKEAEIELVEGTFPPSGSSFVVILNVGFPSLGAGTRRAKGDGIRRECAKTAACFYQGEVCICRCGNRTVQIHGCHTGAR